SLFWSPDREMGKSDPVPSKPNSRFIPQEKYNTEIYLRDKYKYPTHNHYNTTPNDKYSGYKKRVNQQEQKKEVSQFDYIKHNLFIKSCVGSEFELWQFQAKKKSFRNYTPKILDQEANMGMWI
ncbi:hypothetical protein HHI36_021811, partial [Cryptolaemus montrouzieri]